MKKIITLALAAVMVIAFAMPVAAAESKTVPTEVSSVTDANGNSLDVVIYPTEQRIDSANAATVLGTATATVLDVFEVSVPYAQFPVTLTFDVNGVKAGMNVYALHFNAEKDMWEVIPATAGNGTVTATFTSLSPVAIVTTDAAVVSPKTADTTMVWAAMALVAIAGVAVVNKKRA